MTEETRYSPEVNNTLKALMLQIATITNAEGVIVACFHEAEKFAKVTHCSLTERTERAVENTISRLFTRPTKPDTTPSQN